jgi:hypothetical protein
MSHGVEAPGQTLGGRDCSQNVTYFYDTGDTGAATAGPLGFREGGTVPACKRPSHGARGRYRLSKRTTQQALEEIFGVLMSVATVSQWEQATTAS